MPPALAEQFQTITFDWRVGRSTWAPGPYTTELLAEDVVGLLDALQIERAHFSPCQWAGGWLNMSRCAGPNESAARC